MSEVLIRTSQAQETTSVVHATVDNVTMAEFRSIADHLKITHAEALRRAMMLWTADAMGRACGLFT